MLILLSMKKNVNAARQGHFTLPRRQMRTEGKYGNLKVKFVLLPLSFYLWIYPTRIEKTQVSNTNHYDSIEIFL